MFSFLLRAGTLCTGCIDPCFDTDYSDMFDLYYGDLPVSLQLEVYSDGCILANRLLIDA